MTCNRQQQKRNLSADIISVASAPFLVTGNLLMMLAVTLHKTHYMYREDEVENFGRQTDGLWCRSYCLSQHGAAFTVTVSDGSTSWEDKILPCTDLAHLELQAILAFSQTSCIKTHVCSCSHFVFDLVLVITAQTTAAGGVSWEVVEEQAPSSAPKEKKKKKQMKVKVPKWCGKWVVGMDDFKEGIVGAKSKNIAGNHPSNCTSANTCKDL